jgi:hypothetical protein
VIEGLRLEFPLLGTREGLLLLFTRITKVIARKSEFSLFLFHDEILESGFRRQRVTEADAVVEGAKHNLELPAGLAAFAQHHAQFIVLISHVPAFAERILPCRVGRAAHGFQEFHVASELRAVTKPQSEPGFAQNRPAIHVDGVTQRAVHGYRDDDRVVRRR